MSGQGFEVDAVMVVGILTHPEFFGDCRMIGQSIAVYDSSGTFHYPKISDWGLFMGETDTTSPCGLENDVFVLSKSSRCIHLGNEGNTDREEGGEEEALTRNSTRQLLACTRCGGCRPPFG